MVDRRSYAGGAVATTLTSPINSSDETLNIAASTNWPDGSAGDYFIVIDRGTATEEKCLVNTRSSLTLTLVSGGRGEDGTAAVSHLLGATVEVCFTATDADEANRHIADTAQDDHTQYLNTARHDIEARHTFGGAYGTPATPAVIAGASATGSGNNPAREDHVHGLTLPVRILIAMSDETTAITTGTSKVKMRSPFAFTLTDVRGSLSTASSSGTPTVDINEGGSTILSTKLTIDANETTSTTAAAPPVISDSSIADDAELTFDIDVAGTGAKGLKVLLIGTRALS